MPVEKPQSGFPSELGLTAVAKVENVPGIVDHQKLDRTPEFGEPLRQAARLLDASGAIAIAVHDKNRNRNGLRLPVRRSPPQLGLQLLVAARTAGPTEAGFDQPEDKSSPEPRPIGF